MSSIDIAFVLPVADRARGGAETWVLDTASALVDRGHRVSLVSMSVVECPTGVRAVELPAAGSSVSRIRGFWDACADHLPDAGHDIVHAVSLCPGANIVNPHGGAEAVWLEQYLRSKTGIDRSVAALKRRWGRRQKTVFELEEKMYRDPALRRIVAISPFVRDGLKRAYGLPEELFRMLPNGVDTGGFAPVLSGGDKLRLRSARGLRPDERVLLFVGHNFALKGLRQAIEMLAALPEDERARTRLVVVGRGRPGPFRKIASSLGIADRVVFKGTVDSLVEWYRAADLLLAPSWYDACSLATIEALASGIPVLTTETNGACLYLDDDCGVVLPSADDISGGAAAIRQLTADAAADGARRAGPAAVAAHTRESNVEGLLAIYDEVLQS